jgi:prolyl oligopeptidase
MRNTVLTLATVVLLACPLAAAPLHYPPAPRSTQVDDYHGVEVADPYRWLEDTDSPQTRAWVEAENKLTFGYLADIPARQKIHERLTKLWNYERYGIPSREGSRYFYSKNNGLQNQSVLYWTDSLDGEPRLLLDPNKLSSDGTVALTGEAFTDDGKRMAYGLSVAGSDWQEWKVRDVDSGQDLPDDLHWVKFSDASWTKDGQGFFYSRYDEPKAGSQQLKDTNYYQKLYYHRLGTPQSQDALIYQRPDQKEWGFGGYVTEDGQWLIITVWKGTDERNLVFYKSLTEGPEKGKVVELLSNFEAKYSFVANDGPILYFQTTLDSPRGRVVAIDTRQPDKRAWREVIGQTPDTLEGVSLFGNQFIATYLHDAHTVVRRVSLDGKPLGELGLPGLGSAAGFGGKRTDRETFYSYTSYTTPTTIYRYDIASGVSSVYRRPKVDFDPSHYETKQVFYRSKDGTRVPMFITAARGTKLDGNNPTMLYGYGGFDISITPSFSVANLVWMEMGGVYAVANIRGGGEYGEAWHQGGMKTHKQNVFDDFIAAAEWLIANRYTSNKKLAVLGRSNGGLLIGAVMTQRPDLFGAVFPGVGVLDMLRFAKFTIGWAWQSDYGSVDNPQEFKALYAYSPLQNVKDGTHYPPSFIVTADHDDRVFPAHSFKFAAALQHAQAGEAPILIRIETKAGHGAGKPMSKLIDEITDEFAFAVKNLGMKVTLTNP